MAHYDVILQSILSAASSALNAADRAPGRVELVPGTLPAWDDCCEGQLYLRVQEVFPTAGGTGTAPFPAIDTAQRGAAGGACAIHALAVRLGLGVIRCAAVVDESGAAPSPAEVTADGLLSLADMDTLLNVLVCDVPSLWGVKQLKVDRWVPQGVQGGCAGGEWGFYIMVDPCLCQPPAEE